VLRGDPTLWCVSAWNDNGKAQFLGEPRMWVAWGMPVRTKAPQQSCTHTEHPAALHRTDFFPGLGWMLTKDVWRELKPKWPPAYAIALSHAKGRKALRARTARRAASGMTGCVTTHSGVAGASFDGWGGGRKAAHTDPCATRQGVHLPRGVADVHVWRGRREPGTVLQRSPGAHCAKPHPRALPAPRPRLPRQGACPWPTPTQTRRP
jgi:hypothetical protein